ncbi:MAG: hypothetical protein AAF890_08540 [Pseudomonadota bacterium]
MRFLQTIFVFCLFVLLAGCASPAKREAMVPSSLSEVALNVQYKDAISVVVVSGGKTTNPLWVSNISNEDFKASVQSALRANGYTSTSGKYTLEVVMLSVKQPLVGTALTVTTQVAYTLKTVDGSTVFQRTITAPYTAKFSDSLLAVERLRLANEGSARENIRKFIEALSEN